jgi:SAM-dependent methyltransferase
MENNQKYFESRSDCPVCSSQNIVFFKKSSFDIRSLSQNHIKITDSEYGTTWELSRCSNCTHIFANPAPAPSLIQSLYGQVEDPEYEEEEKGRGKNFKRILSRMETLESQKGKLLDVGAATGILVRLAKERGWKAEGIEPSAWAVRRARDTYGIELIEGSFETASLETGAYSAVTMVDYIEHTSHPAESMNKAYRILKSGGILCLVTPDIGSLTARLAGRKWWHFRPGHLGYFTAKSLDFLLQRSGFSAQKKRKYSWTFSAHYLLSRIMWLHFLIKNPGMSLFWKKIPIKLALADSFEIYAVKQP